MAQSQGEMSTPASDEESVFICYQFGRQETSRVGESFSCVFTSEGANPEDLNKLQNASHYVEVSSTGRLNDLYSVACRFDSYLRQNKTIKTNILLM